MSVGWAVRMLLAVAACGVGFLVGYWLAVPDCTCPDCPDSDTHSALDQPPARSTPAPACDPGELVRAREELRRLKVAGESSPKMPADRQPDAVGGSDEWEGAPYQYREAGFRQIMGQAAQELEDQAELVGVDCREPPCMAIMLSRAPDITPSTIRDTRVWKEHFGSGGRSYNALIDCRDGRKEQIEIASPFWDGEHDPIQMDPEDFDQVVKDSLRSRTAEQERRVTVRLANRWRAIRRIWICRPPAGPED